MAYKTRVRVPRGYEDLVAASAVAKLKQTRVSRELLTDPVRFARDTLGHTLWGRQVEILRSVAAHEKTAVKACHASSKTFTAAEAVLWWITHYKTGIALTTAPTWHQTRNLLWGEIHKAVRGAKFNYPDLNQVELRMSEDNYALGLSTDQADRFQGWHGEMLIVFDEAAGVRPALWEAVEGMRAGGKVHMLIIGNPTLAAGPFFDAFTVNAHRWNTITISAFDTPNLKGVTPEKLLEWEEYEPEQLAMDVAPYLTKRAWVLDRYHEWGPDSPLYQSRVLGQFPLQSIDALFPLGWLHAAQHREVGEGTGKLRAGVDVAGPGEDETVCYVCRGGDVIDMFASTEPDCRADVLAFLGRHGAPTDYEVVNVDSIGIGYNFALHIKDRKFPVSLVNVSNSPEQVGSEAKFEDLKAELYWGARELLQRGEVAGLTDQLTISQLSTLKYEQTGTGKVKIESKKKAKERGGKSPDRAEGWILCQRGRRAVGSAVQPKNLVTRDINAASVITGAHRIAAASLQQAQRGLGRIILVR